MNRKLWDENYDRIFSKSANAETNKETVTPAIISGVANSMADYVPFKQTSREENNER